MVNRRAVSSAAPRRAESAELLWPGKYDAEGGRVRAPASRAELRELERFGEDRPDGARNWLVRGDNLDVLDALANRYEGRVDLVYIDPPFWTGGAFQFDAPIGGGKAASARAESGVAYTDAGTLFSYLSALSDRLERIRTLMSETATIFVHVDWHVSHFVRCLLDETFGAAAFKNEIIWRYRRWPAKTRVFQRMHDVIFWYGKNPGSEHAFTPMFEPLAPSTLAAWGTKRQRADFSTGRRKPAQDDEESLGAPLSDVWDIGIVAPIARERVGYPTQKPEALLSRIIEAASRPGDVIADFYCGSGTTLAVANKLGRRFVGCDVGRLAIETTRKRLFDLQAAQPPGDRAPFSVADLGSHARLAWRAREHAGSEAAAARVVLARYGAPRSRGDAGLDGTQGDARIVVAPVEEARSTATIATAVEKARAEGRRELTLLGWDFDAQIREDGSPVGDVRVRRVRIPDEIVAGESGGLFADVPEIAAELVISAGRRARVRLTDLVVPAEAEVPDGVREHLRSWSDWIDGWAVDSDFDGAVFRTRWFAHRIGRSRRLALETPLLPWRPTAKVVVRVVDVLGYVTFVQPIAR